MSHIYSEEFYDYIEIGSRNSAQAMISLLQGNIEVKSVLDAGCGRGAWLSEWERAGVSDVCGIDGDYVVRDKLHFNAEKFQPADLATGFELDRKFDLAQCLEVAEHLPSSAAEKLIASLIQCADIVLFSAATPGQGGEHHINEQPLDYWRQLFLKKGYEAYDAVRPGLSGNADVMPWYKYNTLIYANADGRAKLSSAFVNTVIGEGDKIPSGGGLGWKARKTIVRLLPRQTVNWLATVNAGRVASKIQNQK